MVPEPAPGARASVRLGCGFGRGASGARRSLSRSAQAPAPSVASPWDATSTARPGSTRQHPSAPPAALLPLPVSSPRTRRRVARGPRIARCPHEPQGGQRQGGALRRSPGPGRGGGKEGGGRRQPRRGNPHTAPSQRRVLAPGPCSVLSLGTSAPSRAHGGNANLISLALSLS